MVALTLIAPFWAVGAFVLAVGFLAVPKILLDRKGFAALGAHATSKGRAAIAPMLTQTGPRIARHWSRLVAVTSRLTPFSWTRVPATPTPRLSSDNLEEAQP